MYLRYYLKDGKRIYTFKYVTKDGIKTENAHPARFSPDDKFSQERITLKKKIPFITYSKT